MTVTWQVLEGDARARLAELEPGSVQTCATSPPYFGLRDYAAPGQLGLEATPDEYVTALVSVFREVRRVLRDDGTVWLNLGDSYAGSYGNQGRKEERGTQRAINGGMLTPVLDGRYPNGGSGTGAIPEGASYKAKDLLGIPWMVAFALRADGWYLRSDIIWNKPNPMPESVTDRPTKSHEYVFLLSKGPRYFYDADAIREDFAPYEAPDAEPSDQITERTALGPNGHQPALRRGRAARAEQMYRNAGRNKRSVWTVATQPYPGAHFATFPPRLIEPCILAGTSPKACGECGAPWERVTEQEGESTRAKLQTAGPSAYSNGQPANPQGLDYAGSHGNNSRATTCWGLVPSCPHEDGTGSSVVLDPFAGAGTTGLVALRHNRSFTGIELNPEYADLARWRIRDDAPLLNSTSEAAA